MSFAFGFPRTHVILGRFWLTGGRPYEAEGTYGKEGVIIGGLPMVSNSERVEE